MNVVLIGASNGKFKFNFSLYTTSIIQLYVLFLLHVLLLLLTLEKHCEKLPKGKKRA